MQKSQIFIIYIYIYMYTLICWWATHCAWAGQQLPSQACCHSATQGLSQAARMSPGSSWLESIHWPPPAPSAWAGGDLLPTERHARKSNRTLAGESDGSSEELQKRGGRWRLEPWASERKSLREAAASEPEGDCRDEEEGIVTRGPGSAEAAGKGSNPGRVTISETPRDDVTCNVM
jgi:hypothetical protein